MRDEILANIRRSLRQARDLPRSTEPAPLSASPPRRRDELVAEFAAEWERLGGSFERVAAASAVARACDLLAEAGVRRVLAWEPEALPAPMARLPDELLRHGMRLVDPFVPADRGARQARTAELATADAGITGAEAAIAQVGAVAVRSGPGRGRMASLIAPLHLVCLTPDQFYPTLASWWPKADAGASSVAIIAGPSRTSDIERVLTLGVHGPKRVIALCVE